MLGLSTLLLHPPIPIPIPIQQISKSLSFSRLNNQISPFSSILTLTKNPKIPKRFVICSENNADYDGGGGDYNNNGGGSGYGDGDGDGDGGGGGDLKKDRRIVYNQKSGDLLGPDPDNAAAVALTRSFVRASVQFLKQLDFTLSGFGRALFKHLVIAGLNVSFVACLIFFLVTLL